MYLLQPATRITTEIGMTEARQTVEEEEAEETATTTPECGPTSVVHMPIAEHVGTNFKRPHKCKL